MLAEVVNCDVCKQKLQFKNDPHTIHTELHKYYNTSIFSSFNKQNMQENVFIFGQTDCKLFFCENLN